MNEMAVTAEHLIVIGRGRLIADTAMDALAGYLQGDVLVRTPHPEQFAGLMRAHGATVVSEGDGALYVRDLNAARIGELALAELSPRGASLEEASMRLTEHSTEYRTGGGAASKEGVR
ncbi:ABC-2 type transport system ATP-binding protein [Nonomuraea solani]|uniref:ABC-2 type transport system ATP-binding protein n=1 Tax=Nonomuraea solani TaxID=1144553 RepID=A0A1H6BR07_9ACTN|nr:ABC-2 type transport system ATP-binding protein [Nonomuraea solani]